MQGFPFDSYLTWDEETHLPSYDRGVSSKPLRNLIGQLFTTGVMPNPSNNLQVHAGTDGMTVVVSPGFAVIEGGLCLEENSRTLAITASDPQFDRIDTVVVRWNENDSVRTADLHVVQGVPARNPIRPTLTREGSIYEIGIADIFVTKGVTTITNEKITDTRMESARCGIVSSVSEFDTTTIYQQIQGELAKFKSDEEVAFANWFDYMKDQLTEDAAGRLQTEVDDVRGQIHTNLLNPTLETQTSNGVTCTNNGDGTFTLNGTATGTSGGNVWFNLFGAGNRPTLESLGAKVGHKYRFTCTPHGGSTTTYWSNVSVYKNNTLSESNNDIGNGQEIEIDADETNLQVGINIRVGTTINNVVYKPMLTEDLSATYDSFVKYSGSEERLNEQVASLHESSKGVITNLIDPTLGTTTNNGVTCTANGDGTYTLNGTGTSYWNNFPIETNLTLETGKTYKICGGENHQSTTTYLIELVSIRISDGHRDVVTNEIQKSTFVALSGYKYEYRIHTFENAKFTNVLIKPMLTTDLDATYNDYVPYSGDGRLNENVAALFDMFHPVGSLYPTTNANFDPNTAKGWHGVWERITDCVIYAAGTSDTIGQIVGSNTHTLTEAELPSHSHSIPSLSGTATGGNHRHKYYMSAGNVAGGSAMTSYISNNPTTKYTDYSGDLSMSVTTNASNTGYTGSGTAIDMRPRRLNSIVWRRTA